MSLKNKQIYEVQSKVFQNEEKDIPFKHVENANKNPPLDVFFFVVQALISFQMNKLLNHEDPKIANQLLKEEITLLMKDEQQKKQVIQELRNTLKEKEENINDLEYKLKHFTMTNSQLKIDLKGAKLAFDEESTKTQREREKYHEVMIEIEKIKILHK